MQMRRVWVGVVVGALALAGCQGDAEAPAKAIEKYLAAKVESNVAEMTRLSCPDWEAQAQIEATSFASMDAQLDQVSCTTGAADGDYRLVSCSGQIVTTYQGENRTWSVGDHPYRALNDGGEWRMCGYAP
ncbi:MAG: hypothetical protein IT317_11630 [Anaerolineales bacterium]|nr:hypothetical protein [Anaerolineales bacterium]